jgi:murein DD-endopeptidase MepM/ murein hydrolase activator NlpD
MQAAAIVVAEANRRAQEEVAAAEKALAEATAARQRVLENLRTARRLLEDSVLADQLAAIQALSPGAAAAAAAAVARRFVAGNDGDISFPLPADASYYDQDNFGAKSSHWKRVHTGDDFSTSCGTPVLAVTDGTVMIHTDQTWSGRWLVIVSTGAGQLSTWYAHMEAILVVNGQPVRAGQPIGVVGAQGNATGCHLHLEVHPFGGTIYQDDADPRAWLHAVGVYPG